MRPIDITEVRRLYTYEPDTGELICNTARNQMPKGSSACVNHQRGYLMVKVGKHYMLAHRVIWAIHYGEQPPAEIDHKNRDKKDNRINNLRAATAVENKQNSVGKGYSRLRSGRYQARVKLGGRLISCGTYDTPEEAHAAYINKKKELHSSFVE